MKRYNFDFFATVYGVCIVEGSPAIVMRRMDTDLYFFLKGDKSVTKSDQWKFESALSVARAVEALHKLGILHRDLKSPNILVGADGKRLCIADFGMAQLRKEIASFRKSQTAQGLGKYETVGSYPWMAPEIMQAGKYTEKADVFSLGVIIWEIFSGEEPWDEAVSIQAIERAVLGGRMLDLEGIPMPVAEVLRKIWKESPSERPSAADVVSQLEVLVNTGVAESAPPLTLSAAASVVPTKPHGFETPPGPPEMAHPCYPESVDAGGCLTTTTTLSSKPGNPEQIPPHDNTWITPPLTRWDLKEKTVTQGAEDFNKAARIVGSSDTLTSGELQNFNFVACCCDPTDVRGRTKALQLDYMKQHNLPLPAENSVYVETWMPTRICEQLLMEHDARYGVNAMAPMERGGHVLKEADA